MIEFRLHRNKAMLIMLPGSQTILFIDKEVHSKDSVTLGCQPVGEPAIAGAHVQDLQRTIKRILEPREYIFDENVEAADANCPVRRVVAAEVLERQHTVIICGGAAAS